MSIKMIAFDLDGTALKDIKTISDRNLQALDLAAKKGVYIVPATGRYLNFVPDLVRDISEVRYIIYANGAGIYDKKLKKIVYQKTIPNKTAIKIQEVLDDYDIYVEYYLDGNAVTLEGNPKKAANELGLSKERLEFVKKTYERLLQEPFIKMLQKSGVTPEKINLSFLEPNTKSEILERLTQNCDVELVSSWYDNIEINAAGAGKGDAVSVLAHKLDIAPADVMAIGDSGNDISMLRWAGCSVCMGNGSEEALKTAKYKTGLCMEDGLAQAIERFIEI